MMGRAFYIFTGNAPLILSLQIGGKGGTSAFLSDITNTHDSGAVVVENVFFFAFSFTAFVTINRP